MRAHTHAHTNTPFTFRHYILWSCIYASDLRKSRKPQSATRVSRSLARKQEETAFLSPGGKNFCEDKLLVTLQFPPPAKIERNVACADGSPREYKSGTTTGPKKKNRRISPREIIAELLLFEERRYFCI